MKKFCPYVCSKVIQVLSYKRVPSFWKISISVVILAAIYSELICMVNCGNRDLIPTLSRRKLRSKRRWTWGESFACKRGALLCVARRTSPRRKLIFLCCCIVLFLLSTCKPIFKPRLNLACSLITLLAVSSLFEL